MARVAIPKQKVMREQTHLVAADERLRGQEPSEYFGPRCCDRRGGFVDARLRPLFR